MKRKQYKILAVILCAAVVSGCGLFTDRGKEKGLTKSKQTEEKSEDEKEEKMEEEKKNKEIEDQIDKNTALILSYLDVSQYGVRGCMQKLQRYGCAELTKVEIIDEGEYYSLNLTDSKNDKYYITMGYDGYVGIIEDENGEYLYAPVD